MNQVHEDTETLDSLGVLSVKQLHQWVEMQKADSPYRDWLDAVVPSKDGWVKLTWADLVAMVPALGLLREKISQVVDDTAKPRFCAHNHWYGEFKRALASLVGRDAVNSPPSAQTEAAYDIAYDRCYEALPPCRNCFCLTNADLC